MVIALLQVIQFGPERAGWTVPPPHDPTGVGTSPSSSVSRYRYDVVVDDRKWFGVVFFWLEGWMGSSVGGADGFVRRSSRWNRYVSHAFRREDLGIRACGLPLSDWVIRTSDEALVSTMCWTFFGISLLLRCSRFLGLCALS